MKKVIIIVCLCVIIFLTLYYRVVLPDAWLHGDTLRLPTVDAYYQARFAQIINTHGTDLPSHDPYFSVVETFTIDKAKTPTLWPTLISTLSRLIPTNSDAAIDLVCYYLPPVLAVLCVVGIFVIGALLFNAWVGLLASLLMATMAGEFMARSLAGSADYHVFEVFLLVGLILWVVLAVKNHNKYHGIPSFIFSILAGLFIAVYMKAWPGAVYFYMIILASYVLYLIVLSFKVEAPSGTIFTIPCIILPSSLLFYIILTLLTGTVVDNSLFVFPSISLVIIVIATVAQSFFAHKKNRWGFIVLAGILGMAGLSLLNLLLPKYYEFLLSMITPMIKWSAWSHTSEERPILLFGNEFGLQALWGNFTASIFLCLIGIGMVIKRMIKVDRHTLFNYLFILVGTLIMIITTLAMVRFAYYLTVYVSILSGLVIYTIIQVSSGYLQRNAKKMRWYDKAGDIILVLMIISFVLIPNFLIAKQFTNPLEGTLTPSWEQALLWLKSNSDEPFKDPDYYHANYNKLMLEPNYSVMSWWDYGYWIIYIAHRVPVSNPGSNRRTDSAVFMTTTDNDGAINLLQQTRSRYIIIDYQMVTGKFTAMPTYAKSAEIELKVLSGLGETVHDYIELYSVGDYYQKEEGGITHVNVFYPDYYKSMVVRLYNFNGQVVKSPGCPVIIYKNENGTRWIQKIMDTPSYNQALQYTKDNPLPESEFYAVGGTDPFLPCLDLEAVRDIKPLKGFGGADLSFISQRVKADYAVKIFEYTGGF